jgi:hypothetical protein
MIQKTFKNNGRFGEDLLPNRPARKKVGNHFLTAQCFAHSPQYKLERWCLPLSVPQSKSETLEEIRHSVAHFSAYTCNLTNGERDAAWAKLVAAAKKHGVPVPTIPVTAATHRMNW